MTIGKYERAIVSKVAQALINDGEQYLKPYDGERHGAIIRHYMHAAQILANMGTEEAYFKVYCSVSDKYLGYVYFIFGNGNDGLDVIADNTCGAVEDLLSDVMDWIETLDGQMVLKLDYSYLSSKAGQWREAVAYRAGINEHEIKQAFVNEYAPLKQCVINSVQILS